MTSTHLPLYTSIAAAALLAGCGGGSDPTGTAIAPATATAVAGPLAGRDRGPHAHFNRKPAFVVGEVRWTEYDGVGDDLLTAGLGKSGLAGAAPTYADALAPTAAELRRHAIYTNYRAIVDTTAQGGYGSLYGPNVAADGSVTSGEGRIAGTEVLAYSRGTEASAPSQNVALMVQIPAAFDPRRPCIVTATSSGSRGVYGAISVGEWGLKRGCAVAYTDKGTGAAPHDLGNDTVPLIDGTRSTAALAGDAAQFRAALDDAQLAAYNAATPGRYAFKHAHSQRNPERDWGRFTLQAVEFAYWVLNERYGIATGHGERVRLIRPGRTTVIASSLSNGGSAALAAAELDRSGLIDGVAVSEPSVELPADAPVQVWRGGVRQPAAVHLFDYITQAQLYQACAALSPQVAGAPGAAFLIADFAAKRCASLKAQGLLEAESLTAQADEAQARLAAAGWEPGGAVLHTSLAAFEVSPAIAVTYANAYARASVADRLCGYSFAATTAQGAVTTLAAASLASMAATGNGVPPSAGVQLVNDLSPGLPLRDLFSFSPSSGVQDFNLDGALCLRGLLDGSDAPSRALQAGLAETRRSGDLHGKPAIIVHGRDDALIPVNHSSRPYTALNRLVEGRHSRLSYIEVTNAQHFDAFIGSPLLGGYDTRFVPLHVYLFRALDAMDAHLRHGAALPASQVVRTVPRGGLPGAAPALTEANVPPFVRRPAAADAIVVRGNAIRVPE
mgnify:CR=1 FL=1